MINTLIIQNGYKTDRKSQILLNSTTALLKREIDGKLTNQYKKNDWVPVPIDIEMDALSCLANKMYINGKPGFYGQGETATATAVLEKKLRATRYKPLDVIREAEAATITKKYVYLKQLVFFHPILQDFFAAYYFQNEENSDFVKLFIANAKNTRQWNVLFLLAELLEIQSYDTFKTQIQQIAVRLQKHKYLSFALVGIIFNTNSIPLKLKQDILNSLVKNINENWHESSIFARELLYSIEKANATKLTKELLENSNLAYQNAGVKLLGIMGIDGIHIAISLLSSKNLYQYAINLLISFEHLAIESIINIFSDIAEKTDTETDIDEIINSPKIARACTVLNELMNLEILNGLGRFKFEESKKSRSDELKKLISTKMIEHLEPYYKTNTDNILFDNPFLLETLLNAIGIAKDESAIPFLEKLLQKKENSARKKALDCLAKIRSNNALNIIYDTANNYPEIEIRGYALSLWENIVIADLQIALNSGDIEKARITIKQLQLKSIITMYGISQKQIKDFLSSELLIQKRVKDINVFAKSENVFIRENAIELLGDVGQGDSLTLTVVLNSLNDEKDHIKYKAIQTIGKIGNIENIKNLEPFLRSNVEISYGKIADVARESIEFIESRNKVHDE